MDQAINPAALETLVARIALIAVGYTISFEVGKRYARLIKTDESGGRSTYGFADMTNGNLLKAAGWKGPAKGVRGHVSGNLACCSRWSIS